MNRTLHSITLSLLAAALLLGGSVAEAKPGDKAPAAQKAPAAAQAAQGVVNINTASEEQLKLLPRIGASKARRIVQYRTKQKFKTTWDLAHVKGIGRKTLRRLRPFLVVQGETTLTAKAKLDKESN